MPDAANVKSPCGTNIPIPNSSVGFSIPYPNIPQGIAATHHSVSLDGSGLSHFGSPIASSPLTSNSLTSPLGVHHPLTSTPKSSSLSSPNQSSSITNVASAPAALAAPTPKPKGFFRPYSTSPTPPKVSDSESQNVSSSASDNFNAPPPRQLPFSYSQHPAYRLPNTTTPTSSLGGNALIPQPGAFPTSFNGIRGSPYLPLDHNRIPPHPLSSASVLSPFVATSGYPEYSLANSALNNNHPYYPNYPGRSLNGPSSSSNSIPTSISSSSSSFGYNPNSSIAHPNSRPGTGLPNSVAPYYPPSEANGALSTTKTTVPCSTSTSTVPSHHQDLSSKSTHSR